MDNTERNNKTFELENSDNKNLERLQMLKKEFNLDQRNNTNKFTNNENKFSDLKKNVLSKSRNEDLEDILTKLKKTRIFLKHSTNENEDKKIPWEEESKTKKAEFNFYKDNNSLKSEIKNKLKIVDSSDNDVIKFKIVFLKL